MTARCEHTDSLSRAVSLASPAREITGPESPLNSIAFRASALAGCGGVANARDTRLTHRGSVDKRELLDTFHLYGSRLLLAACRLSMSLLLRVRERRQCRTSFRIMRQFVTCCSAEWRCIAVTETRAESSRVVTFAQLCCMLRLLCSAVSAVWPRPERDWPFVREAAF